MTGTLQKTGVGAFISCHTTNRTDKAALAAVPKQAEECCSYSQPAAETLPQHSATARR